MRALLAALVLLLATPSAWAHAMSSAQWRVTQADAQTWDSRLRLPEDFEGNLLSLEPHWPASCTQLGDTRSQPADEGVVLHWRLRCPQGLDGALGLVGFTVQLPDAVLLVQPLEGEGRYSVLSAAQPEWQPGEQAGKPPVAH